MFWEHEHGSEASISNFRNVASVLSLEFSHLLPSYDSSNRVGCRYRSAQNQTLRFVLAAQLFPFQHIFRMLHYEASFLPCIFAAAASISYRRSLYNGFPQVLKQNLDYNCGLVGAESALRVRREHAPGLCLCPGAR